MAVVGWRKLGILMTLATLSGVHSAPAQAPAPAPDCSNVVLSLAGCFAYVSAGSTAAKPEKDCCAGLKSVLKEGVETSGVYCLCDAFKNGEKEYDVKLNMSKAVGLPLACNVTFSLKDSCHIELATAPVPAHSPTAISPSPSVPGTPGTLVPGTPSSGTGAGEAPSAQAPGSSGSSSSSSSSLLTTPVALLVLTAIFVHERRLVAEFQAAEGRKMRGNLWEFDWAVVAEIGAGNGDIGCRRWWGARQLPES
ncbi:non-specific lipid-transfer protein-like protein at2g13820 [Phtheirospermum japonicum]|uniref:Non-specific lipid-transfer protein-like protein at2g13820 n=1 Tax=Phtheirospermum japonicum TaxID=374723 RepID=A0A830BTX8_9LAMI|nr:non-specific lipid-transfer protein-like protein at2g13820 [Phtheirospermum japonicum]